jgi:hypothetical protein
VSTHTDPSEWTVFTFLPGSVDVARAGDLLASGGLGFEPQTVRVSVLGEEAIERPYDDGVWQSLRETSGVIAIDLESGLLQPSATWSWTDTGVQVSISDVPAPAALVDRLVDVPGLLGGASGDATDARWQGETEISHYRMWYDQPWEHLPRTTDEWGDEIIDVSGNPGRVTDVPGMRLWAAQDLWFGPGSALVIAHDAIATLPVGRVTDLGDGRWHVRLWEDATPLEEVRKAQQVLREHLGYDAAEARVDAIRDALTAGRPDDPMFLAQEGSFPHGGTTRILQYFSASKHPTTRSRAAWLNVQEYDEHNTRVHDEYVDLTAQPHPDLD